MARKYLGVERYPWHLPGDERVVVVVEPDRVTQMGLRSPTRHREFSGASSEEPRAAEGDTPWAPWV